MGLRRGLMDFDCILLGFGSGADGQKVARG